jgi:hypothetical protein
MSAFCDVAYSAGNGAVSVIAKPIIVPPPRIRPSHRLEDVSRLIGARRISSIKHLGSTSGGKWLHNRMLKLRRRCSKCSTAI